MTWSVLVRYEPVKTRRRGKKKGKTKQFDCLVQLFVRTRYVRGQMLLQVVKLKFVVWETPHTMKCSYVSI